MGNEVSGHLSSQKGFWRVQHDHAVVHFSFVEDTTKFLGVERNLDLPRALQRKLGTWMFYS